MPENPDLEARWADMQKQMAGRIESLEDENRRLRGLLDAVGIVGQSVKLIPRG